jgi:hypothetical protein
MRECSRAVGAVRWEDAAKSDWLDVSLRGEAGHPPPDVLQSSTLGCTRHALLVVPSRGPNVRARPPFCEAQRHVQRAGAHRPGEGGRG